MVWDCKPITLRLRVMSGSVSIHQLNHKGVIGFRYSTFDLNNIYTVGQKQVHTHCSRS